MADSRDHGADGSLANAVLGATFEAATLYVRTSILANGAATGAWLAYIGATGGAASKLPAGLFTIGLVLAWLASLFNYFGQRANWEHVRSGKQPGAMWRWCQTALITATVLAILSIAAFAVGAWLAYEKL